MECTAAGFPIPADYTCMYPGCDLKALCAVHVMLHRQWGHGVTGLAAADAGDSAPGPDTLLGVTHCPKPEHSGAEGLLTHHCRQCESLLCRDCSDEHLAKDHTVWPLGRTAADAVAFINAALPALRDCHARHLAQAAQLRQMQGTLAASREAAVAALAANTARRHAEVDAQHAAALVELEAAYDSKMCVMEKALKEARCCTAEVVTVTAAAEAVLGPGSSAITRVHVSQSVAASLAAVDEIQPPDVQSVVYVDGGAPLVAGSVGRIVSGLDDLGKSKGNLRDGGEDGVVVESESDSDDGVGQVRD